MCQKRMRVSTKRIVGPLCADFPRDKSRFERGLNLRLRARSTLLTIIKG
jgi:hypothetical protein